jgi:hypothetical protein
MKASVNEITKSSLIEADDIENFSPTLTINSYLYRFDVK